jgi:hypothetical protein
MFLLSRENGDEIVLFVGGGLARMASDGVYSSAAALLKLAAGRGMGVLLRRHISVGTSAEASSSVGVRLIGNRSAIEPDNRNTACETGSELALGRCLDDQAPAGRCETLVEGGSS